MRTDKRFQISLGSELDRSKSASPPINFTDTNVSFSTGFDTTSNTLTEAKFRHGLDATLEMTNENED